MRDALLLLALFFSLAFNTSRTQAYTLDSPSLAQEKSGLRLFPHRLAAGSFGGGGDAEIHGRTARHALGVVLFSAGIVGGAVAGLPLALTGVWLLVSDMSGLAENHAIKNTAGVLLLALATPLLIGAGVLTWVGWKLMEEHAAPSPVHLARPLEASSAPQHAMRPPLLTTPAWPF